MGYHIEGWRSDDCRCSHLRRDRTIQSCCQQVVLDQAIELDRSGRIQDILESLVPSLHCILSFQAVSNVDFRKWTV